MIYSVIAFERSLWLSVSYFRRTVFACLENFWLKWIFRHLAAPWISVCVCVLSSFTVHIVFESLILNGAQTIWLLYFFFRVYFGLFYYVFVKADLRIFCHPCDFNTVVLPIIAWQFLKIFKKKKRWNLITPVVVTLFFSLCFNTKIIRTKFINMSLKFIWISSDRTLNRAADNFRLRLSDVNDYDDRFWGSDHFSLPILASLEKFWTKKSTGHDGHMHTFQPTKCTFFHGSTLKQSREDIGWKQYQQFCQRRSAVVIVSVMDTWMWKNHWIITFQHRFPEFVRLYFSFVFFSSSPSYSCDEYTKRKTTSKTETQLFNLLTIYRFAVVLFLVSVRSKYLSHWFSCCWCCCSFVLLYIFFSSTMFCYCYVHFNHKITESNHVFICCVSMIFACLNAKTKTLFHVGWMHRNCSTESLVLPLSHDSKFNVSPFDALYFSF